MNWFEATIHDHHRALLARWSATARPLEHLPNGMGAAMLGGHGAAVLHQTVEAPSSGPIEAEARLERVRIALIGSGPVGYQTATNLAELPLGGLGLIAIDEADRAGLAAAAQTPQRRVRTPFRPPSAYRGDSLELLVGKYHLVVVATERPFPTLFNEVNTACVRMGTVLTQVLLWGTDINLGPTVLPGATACWHCYQRRRAANDPRPEVSQAREQFFGNDPHFVFQGRIAPLINLAAALVTAEAQRLLVGEPAPATLSRVMTFDGLIQAQRFNQVIPLEGCPVCADRFPPPPGETLATMIERLHGQQGCDDGR